ncbi:hypothetical protein HS041_07155 [Planomonospora sp. ID67723]|uniref:hypothetical protein n=1 Tax=Planomonospora sp. ID67723 TaxID=2738134 RepID=UPI0018C40A98|nr:hypothetical protein [Planomonospora sp. ID67723]MBG0827539.1 hypothetical protein [Planomonospora sp. ID67723]
MNAFTWVLIVVFGGAAVILIRDGLISRRRPGRKRISVPVSILKGARLHEAQGGVDGVMLLNQEARRAHDLTKNLNY